MARPNKVIQRPPTKWTQEQKEILEKEIKNQKIGPSQCICWRKVASKLANKTSRQCYDKWQVIQEQQEKMKTKQRFKELNIKKEKQKAIDKENALIDQIQKILDKQE